MSDYIRQWLDIIENMNNDNTYKLAWGRALLECILYAPSDDLTISFDEISRCMLKYYWNQVFFFKLKQGPTKIPVIVQLTQECIHYYTTKQESTIPVWFDYAESILKSDSDFYKSIIRRSSNTLKENVSWRFKHCKTHDYPIYDLNLKQKTVVFTKQQVIELKDYAFVLSQLLNYRWAQLLERFNTSPKIALKVKGISDNKLRRKNLAKFRDILLSYKDEDCPVDFYTGEILKKEDISVDHVLPWSFLYSDDLWNLVLTSKSHNSRKSNSIPDEATIKRLNDRNKKLVNIIKDPALKDALKLAVEHNYVDKFYMNMKI